MAKRTTSRESDRPALYRCLTDCAVQSIPHEYSKAFGTGAVIDLNDPVTEGVTLGDLLKDKKGDLPEGLFQRVEPPAPLEPPAVRVTESGFEEET